MDDAVSHALDFVVLTQDDASLFVDLEALASVSLYFGSLRHFKEAEKRCLRISDWSSADLQTVLHYLFSSIDFRLHFQASDMLLLLHASHYFGLTELEQRLLTAVKNIDERCTDTSGWPSVAEIVDALEKLVVVTDTQVMDCHPVHCALLVALCKHRLDEVDTYLRKRCPTDLACYIYGQRRFHPQKIKTTFTWSRPARWGDEDLCLQVPKWVLDLQH